MSLSLSVVTQHIIVTFEIIFFRLCVCHSSENAIKRVFSVQQFKCLRKFDGILKHFFPTFRLYYGIWKLIWQCTRFECWKLDECVFDAIKMNILWAEFSQKDDSSWYIHNPPTRTTMNEINCGLEFRILNWTEEFTLHSRMVDETISHVSCIMYYVLISKCFSEFGGTANKLKLKLKEIYIRWMKPSV